MRAVRVAVCCPAGVHVVDKPTARAILERLNAAPVGRRRAACA